MDNNELTPDEILALADTFSDEGRARALLRLAKFPPRSIPSTANFSGFEFWSAVADLVASGVMPDGRGAILGSARRIFPANTQFPDLPAVSGGGGGAISVDDSRGIQAGDHNIQLNYFVPAPYQGGNPRERPASMDSAATRVLVIGASPDDPDLPHVRADRESHVIEKVAAPERVEVKLVLGAEATDVRKVGTFRPDIVHFICHGEAGSLVFNDTRGEADFVPATRVADLLRFYRDTDGVRLRGVVLAACDGGTIASSFAGVADTVIAHRGKLSDPCGVAFAEQLYTRLNDSQDLAAAAREAAQLTAQYSGTCEAVIANLIVLPDGG